jgi:hypothetical protein
MRMKKAINLESLKAERKALMEELQVIDKLIAIHERRHKVSKVEKQQGWGYNTVPHPISTREEVVTTVYNLVRELGRAVTSKEIFERAEKIHIFDKVKGNKQALLAAILNQITKKKKPELHRVARGVYDIIRGDSAKTFTTTIRDPNTGKLVGSEAEFEKK